MFVDTDRMQSVRSQICILNNPLIIDLAPQCLLSGCTKARNLKGLKLPFRCQKLLCGRAQPITTLVQFSPQILPLQTVGMFAFDDMSALLSGSVCKHQIPG